MRKETEQNGSVEPRTNRLLSLLSAADYDAVMREGKVVTLKFRKRIHHQDKPIDAAYFPLTSMISLLVTGDDKPRMEMATIGREGVVGACELLENQGSMGLSLVQIPGLAVKVDADTFRLLTQKHPELGKIVRRHLYALLRQVLYGAACNSMHSMEERCARWLLMTHDRAGSDTFPLTQEFLSHMLGVRRATVNVATGMLKKAGLIHYIRGKVTVLDRRGLESVSCDCYRNIANVYDAVFTGAPVV